MSILIAVGNVDMSNILRRHLEEATFDVVENDVFHRNYLNEIIELENPSMLILHDQFLPSDFAEQEKRDEELLNLLTHWRIRFEGLRVVFLCERDKRDPFLGDLVARNVFDIFYEREIPAISLTDQLAAPPRYANVSKLGVGTLTIDYEEETNEEVQIEAEPDVHIEEHTEQKDIPIISKHEKVKKPRVEKPAKPPKEKREKKEKFLFSDLKLPSVQIHVHKETEQQKLQVTIGRKIIVMVSPYPRMGSTFVSHQLAYQLAKNGVKVEYYENPFRVPYTYDRFAGHLKKPTYTSSYSNNQKSQTEWVVDGVSIQALNPSQEREYSEDTLSISRFLRMFLSKHDTPYLLIDIGADTEKSVYDELIEIASHVFVVMEPDIPKLEWFEQHPNDPQFNWIHRIRDLDKTSLVVNRFCLDAKDALPPEEYFTISSFDDSWVFKSQLDGTVAFSTREGKRMQEEEFQPLLVDVVGADFFRKSKSEKRRFFPRIKISTS